MDEQRTISTGRIKLVLALGIALIAIILIRSWLTQGRITITASGFNAQVSLERLSNGKTQTVKTAQGSLQARVPAGEYLISAHNNSGGVEEKVIIKARQHVRRHLTVDDQSPAIESVLPNGIYDMVADHGNMFYLDSRTRQLNLLDSRGVPTVIDASQTYKSLKWADPGFGIGLTDNGVLRLVRDGVVTDLTLPAAQNGSALDYAVTSNRSVYLSIGKTVYASGSDLVFKKLAETEGDTPALYASNGVLAIKDHPKEDDKDNKPGGYQEAEPEVSIITIDGKKTSKELEAGELSWSPDGRHLAVAEEFAIAIFDTSLNEVAELAQSSSTNLTWRDNNTLLFGSGFSAWEYGLNSKQSKVLANTIGKETVLALYMNHDHSQAYVVSEPGGADDKLKTGRIGLTETSRNIPDYLSTLSVFFPSQTDQCNFSYSNFVRVVLIITVWQNPDTCADAAKEELKADGLPVSGFDIVLDPAEAEND
jgi:hypothetical protein